MTTAREQAREAASYRMRNETVCSCILGADAASDVWEPLLRRAVGCALYILDGELDGPADYERFKVDMMEALGML